MKKMNFVTHTKRLLIPFLVLFSSIVFAQDIFVQRGKASFYADKFEGRTTANGEKYKHSKATAAHLTLPFGTQVKVTNLKNNLSVVVRINDRGPYVEGRIIDLSLSSAKKLEFVNDGLTDVIIQVLDYEQDVKGSNEGGRPVRPEVDEMEEKEFYKFETRRIKPKGFGVQIGSYMELANLMKVSDNLRSAYQKEVTIQVSKINNLKVYKIILGSFPNRVKAGQFKNKVEKDYPDSFIVSFEG